MNIVTLLPKVRLIKILMNKVAACMFINPFASDDELSFIHPFAPDDELSSINPFAPDDELSCVFALYNLPFLTKLFQCSVECSYPCNSYLNGFLRLHSSCRADTCAVRINFEVINFEAIIL